MTKLRYFSVLLLFYSTNYAFGVRTKDKMYDRISGGSACFRRMNGTHQIGCTSSRQGSTGVVHVVETERDLHYLLSKGRAGPYIPVIPTSLFTLPVIEAILTSNQISGVMVFKETKPLANFSHEYQCPNGLSGLPSTCSRNWNPSGTGLLHRDFPFPIFYVQYEDDVSKIRDCFQKFNNFSFESQHERPLCSVEINSFMFATTDTPTCLRRSNAKLSLNPVRFCDPIGGENIWASLHPVAENGTEAAKVGKYVVVSVRLDSTSMFNEVVPGAANPVTGIVTLLTAAQLLKKMLPTNDGYDTNVLFFLLNGETYDYIGSQRMFYDMETDAFPFKLDDEHRWVPQIRPENISLFIELSQLSHRHAVYAHILENSTETANFLKKLDENKANLSLTQNVGVLPPASLQTFLKKRRDLNGVVLADHGDTYANAFYNSIYDNASNVYFRYFEDVSDIPTDSLQRYLASVADMVARSVYEEVTGKGFMGADVASVAMVNELLSCYLENPNCKVHQAIQKKKLRDNPYGFYVGVTVAPSTITTMIGLTLAWLTGDVFDGNCTNDPKNHIFRYVNMSKGIDDLNTTLCYRTTLNFMEAMSPAFLVDNYDWKSTNYSTWTESTWQDIKVRLFLRPSRAHEIFTITLGTTMLGLSMIVVYFLRANSHILFASAEMNSPTSC